MVDLVIVGAGGFGRETLDVIEAINRIGGEQITVIGVVDDAPNELSTGQLAARGYRHLGSSESVLAQRPASGYVIAVGSPQVRRQLAARFDDAGWHAATLVHPSAVCGSGLSISPGVIVCAGVQVSTNVHLGAHVHLNPGAIIGHDSRLDDFVSVNPGAVISGEVDVASGVLVGAAATVLQGLDVGEGAIVGAGACVTRSVPAQATVVGIPARPLGSTVS